MSIVLVSFVLKYQQNVSSIVLIFRVLLGIVYAALFYAKNTPVVK